VIVTGTGDLTNMAEVFADAGDPSDTHSSNNTSGVTITVSNDPIEGECGYLSGVGIYDVEGNGD